MNFFFHSFLKNPNLFILYTFITFSYCAINKEFQEAKYIDDFNTYDEYKEAFKNNKLKNGFLLIYSPFCHHCINFAPKYIKLSEVYHQNLFFYASGTDHGKYHKDFNFRGFPTILFYNDSKYTEYHSNRGVDKLSKFIRNSVHQLNCTEISYKMISTVNQDIYTEKERNIIIGFFNEEEKIKTFKEITNSLTYGYIDLCYYLIRNESTNDIQDKKSMDMKENEIWTNNKIKGENKFIFDEKNYQKNLFENVINIFEDINKEEDIYLFERMKNKDYILFTYNDENTKKDYIEKINKLFDDNKQKIFLQYYFILYNQNTNPKKLNNLENNKIYLISNEFQNQLNIEDLNEFLHITDDNKNNSLENENKEDESNLISNKNNLVIIKESNINIKDNNKDIKNESNIKNNSINENKNKSDKNENSQTIIDIKIEIKNDNITFINSKSEIIKESNNLESKTLQMVIEGNNLGEDNLLNNESKKITLEENPMNDIKNKKIISNPTKMEKKETKISRLKSKKIFNQKGIYHPNFKNKTIRDKKNNDFIKNKNNFKKNDNIPEKKQNSIMKILIILLIISFVIYTLVTKYLCVGFIKVNDNQIIEFNNQSNKIEIV